MAADKQTEDLYRWKAGLFDSEVARQAKRKELLGDKKLLIREFSSYVSWLLLDVLAPAWLFISPSIIFWWLCFGLTDGPSTFISLKDVFAEASYEDFLGSMEVFSYIYIMGGSTATLIMMVATKRNSPFKNALENRMTGLERNSTSDKEKTHEA